MDRRTLGIVGGGQLGRMTMEAAHRLNVRTLVLDKKDAPATQISSESHVEGAINDSTKVKELAEKCDILTIEIEHVDTKSLANCGKPVAPSPDSIALIQDKFRQKQHLQQHGLPTPESEAVSADRESLANFGAKYGFPFVLKSRRDAYDGRGNSVVRNADSIPRALEELHDRELYAEKWAPFTKELAVMVVRSWDGATYCYPVVETVHKDNICHTVFAPAPVSNAVEVAAEELSRAAVASLKGAGVFGVEMFLLEDDTLLINEIAPRPHNSGHYTQNACATSQFEAHVRACMGLPMPAGFTNFITPSTHAIMLNVLGSDVYDGELELCRRALELPGCAVHLYGKSSRPKRKVGHINITGDSMAACESKLAYIQGDVKTLAPQPEVGVIMGSDSDLPVMRQACAQLEKFGIPYECSIVSAHRTPTKMAAYAFTAAERGLKVIIAGAGGAAHLPGMVAAQTCLPVIGVPVKGSCLGGVDSLYSIVQMPRGVPVATVAINNATNAGLLAVRILGSASSKILGELDEFATAQAQEVYDKDEKLLEAGPENYSWPPA